MLPLALALVCATQVPSKELRALDQETRKLARAGHRAETETALDVLRELGYSERQLTNLKNACNRDLRKKPGKLRAAPIIKSISRFAKGLVAHMAEADESTKRKLASQILRLDHRIGAAHEVLGHELEGGVWVDASAKRPRDGEIQAALIAARQIPIEVRPTESTNSLVNGVLQRPATVVRAGDATIHTSLPVETATAWATEALRATAFGEFLWSGQVKPAPTRPLEFVIFDEARHYEAMLTTLLEAEALSTEEASSYIDGFHFWDQSNEQFVKLAYDAREVQSFIATELLRNRRGDIPQTFLADGYFNWVCLAYTGHRLPVFGTGIPALAEDAELVERLEFAGIHGSIARLRWLVEWGEEMNLQEAMKGGLGEIRGNDLVKTTLALRSIGLRGNLKPVFEACPASEATDSESRATQIAAAIDQPIAELERDVLRTLTPPSVSIIAALENASAEPSKSDKELLDYLLALRKLSTLHDPREGYVELDVALSRDARAHARYLNNHPEAGRFQDPNAPDFSAGGARAGANAAIALDASSWESALSKMLGSCLDRARLLQPGLLKIGAALEDGVAVIDCDSVVFIEHRKVVVAFPYGNMQETPTRGTAGAESPIDGVDPGKCGFPITLLMQRGRESPGGAVTMTLFLGDPIDNDKVDCYSTLVGPNGWGLIPKAPLKRRETYWVQVEFASSDADALIWKFDT